MFSATGERRNSRLLQVKGHSAAENANCSSRNINNYKEKLATKIKCNNSQLFYTSNISTSKSKTNDRNSNSNVDDEEDDTDVVDDDYSAKNVKNNDKHNCSTNNQVNRATPILYSTNRGLHLRLTKLSVSNLTKTSSSVAYDLRFCDLERWNTNRANNINLEDTSRTFTISTPPLKSADAVSNSDSLRKSFVPIKGPFYFNSHFARFDIK